MFFLAEKIGKVLKKADFFSRKIFQIPNLQSSNQTPKN